MCRGSHSAQRGALGCCHRAVKVQPHPGAMLRSQNLSDLKYPLATAAPVPPDTLRDVQVALEHSRLAEEEYVGAYRCSLTFESA